LDHLELRKEIVQTCRRMSALGLVAGTEGNVSGRTSEGNVLITPSGLDYARLGRGAGAGEVDSAGTARARP